jgi:hypothetical protein
VTPDPIAGERSTLSRELSVFLVQFSIALHKNGAYPEGHPLLRSAVGAVILRLHSMLAQQPTLLIGVARNQLLIDGVATEPENPVLRDLSNRLHRHQLGAIKFAQGVTPSEVADVMRTLSADSRTDPLGLQAPERLQRWAHVRLFPHAYDQLELSGVEGQRLGHGDVNPQTAGGRLWVGLAAAALMREGGGPVPTDPKEIAQAINGRRREATYDQAIVDYLKKLGQELRLSHGVEANELKERMTGLLGELNADTLKHLMALSGDLATRQQFVNDATQAMPVGAVMTLLKAAAESSEQTISHAMMRLLTKLALHAEQGAPSIRRDADHALRDTVKELVSNWSLNDPNPGGYTKVLERLASATPTASSSDQPRESEALRLVQMSLELGVMGEAVRGAVDDLLEQGKATELLTLLGGPEAPPDMVDAIWQHLATPEVIRRMLMNEPRDTEVIERLIARMGVDAADPMLDALEIADSRTARRRLLTRLGAIGPAIGGMVVDRLPGSPWFVQRNLLALLGSLPSWPRNFSPTPYATNSDPRVRREALKLMLRLPALRDEAIAATLADDDEQIIRLGFSAATESCPPSVLPRLMTLLNDRSRNPELRALGIRVLINVRTPSTRKWLVEQSLAKKRLFRGRRLVAKSPDLLAMLAVLGKNWDSDPGAAEVLRLARRSSDPEVRGAAQTPKAAS